MSYFLEELKRRNVFKVGAAYLVVSWLILQFVQSVREPLGLPEWTDAFFIVLLSVGFPLALLFAWAFELTPDGVKKTRDVDKESSVTATTGRKLNYAIIVTLALALAYSVFDRVTQVDIADATTEPQQNGTSIAVLPFVNMSSDENQEYFSDGISEELLNVLARIPELRVAALSETLGLDTQAAPKVLAATNTDAYNSYLLGQHLVRQRTKPSIEASLTHFERALELDPARASSFAGFVLNQQRRTADGVVTLLRGSERAPENTRLPAIIAFHLYNLGLRDEARRIWPFDNVDEVLADPEDHQGFLQIAEAKYEENPDSLDAMETLAWDKAVFLFMRGDNDGALEALEFALSREVGNEFVVSWEFEELGWNELPRFAAIRKKYNAYRAEERTKLLRTACGEIGFSNWKPLEENCKKEESI